jgi:hypothetical protein
MGAKAMIRGAKKFECGGKTYEVRTTTDGSLYNIRVFLDNQSLYQCSFKDDTPLLASLDVDRAVDLIIDDVKTLLI